MPPAAAVAGAAALGGIAGSQKDRVQSTSGVHAGNQTAFEKLFEKAGYQEYEALLAMSRELGGDNDVKEGRDAYRSFADLLKQYSETGVLPTQADTQRGQALAEILYKPQQLALERSYRDQQTDVARLAAQLGRPVNDPILQAKMRTGFMEQQGQLTAQSAAFAAQQAYQSPYERMGFQEQRASILSNLAQQAFQNRAAVLGLGAQLSNADRNFRVGAGERYGEQTSGGGLKGAINGMFAGAGAGMKMASGMGGFGGGGFGGGGMGGMTGGSYTNFGGIA